MSRVATEQIDVSNTKNEDLRTDEIQWHETGKSQR